MYCLWWCTWSLHNSTVSDPDPFTSLSAPRYLVWEYRLPDFIFCVVYMVCLEPCLLSTHCWGLIVHRHLLRVSSTFRGWITLGGLSCGVSVLDHRKFLMEIRWLIFAILYRYAQKQHLELPGRAVSMSQDTEIESVMTAWLMSVFSFLSSWRSVSKQLSGTLWSCVPRAHMY